MARPQLILPQADASCGKTFYSDRRTADGHRIALEVWNRATGRVREGYRLAAYRCRRCGGFHVGQKPIVDKPVHAGPGPGHGTGCVPYARDEPAKTGRWIGRSLVHNPLSLVRESW